MKYVIYYEFILEAQDIDTAEKEAYDIFEVSKLNKDLRVKNLKVTARGTD